MFRLSALFKSTLVAAAIVASVAAYSDSHIDNSSSDDLVLKSDKCGEILQEAVELAENAANGLKLTAEESNARANVRKRLSDCSETYLDSVDGVLTKFIENKP